MRIALAMMLWAAFVFAQDDQTAVAAAACGPANTSFDVKLDKSQHRLAQPEPGKARVYFVQEIGEVSCLGGCVTGKIGIDGAWAGANRRNSYFSVSVEPGEHHLCANPESRVALAHFTAEAGKVYFFRLRYFSFERRLFDFDAIDSDQGKQLIASYPLSLPHPTP
jgi:hypothetical protein